MRNRQKKLIIPVIISAGMVLPFHSVIADSYSNFQCGTGLTQKTLNYQSNTDTGYNAIQLLDNNQYSGWSTGLNNDAEAIFDLSESAIIKEVHMFSNEFNPSSGELQFELLDENGNSINQSGSVNTSSNGWNSSTVNGNSIAKKIKLMRSNGENIFELRICVKDQAPPPPPPTACNTNFKSSLPLYTVDKALGSNFFEGTFPSNLFGNMRVYHSMAKNIISTGEFYFDSDKLRYDYVPNSTSDPSYTSWAVGFRDFNKHNLIMFPAIVGGIIQFGPNSEDRLTDFSLPNHFPWYQQAPIDPNLEAQKPSSYEYHSNYLYSLVNFFETEPAYADVEMRAFDYIENWNEPDRSWISGKNTVLGMLSPQEYAAQSSADFDGHCGQLGSHFGVKSANPDIAMVMGGLTRKFDSFDGYGGNTAQARWLDAAGNVVPDSQQTGKDFVEAMVQWSAENRNGAGNLPFDVINVHHYSTKQNASKDGISPEADNLEKEAYNWDQWRDTYNAEYGRSLGLNFSEYGYTTDSPKAGYWQSSASPENQAKWLVRSALAFLAHDPLAIQQYWYKDTAEPNTGQWDSNSGVITKDGVKKPSHDVLVRFKENLTGMRFKGKVCYEGEGLNIYAFQQHDGSNFYGKGAYVAWEGTTDHDELKEQIKLNNLTGTAVYLKDGASTSFNQLIDGVSEYPVIIKVNQLANHAFEGTEDWDPDLKISCDDYRTMPAPIFPETPWQTASDNISASGQSGITNIANLTYGYEFTPNSDGEITALGGKFSGTKTVVLFDNNGSQLASIPVDGDNGSAFAYSTLTPPVDVVTGQNYTVAVIQGDTPSSVLWFNGFPVVNKNITIIKATSGWSSSLSPDQMEMPTDPDTSVRGMVDIKFVPSS